MSHTGSGAYKPNGQFTAKEHAARQAALKRAVELAREKLERDGRLPYKTGRLTGGTYADDSLLKEGEMRLVSEAPYAARLYYHPEYRFDRRVNKRAGGRWFETFINGEDKGFIEAAFAARLRELT